MIVAIFERCINLHKTARSAQCCGERSAAGRPAGTDATEACATCTIYRGLAYARHFVWGANILAISLHAGAAREQAPREEEDKRMIVPAHDANLHSQPTAHRA